MISPRMVAHGTIPPLRRAAPPLTGRAVKVSFVIPTRNQVAFIRRCIDACLAQRVPDAEVLVADGLSTDGTQAVLAAYGDRIRWKSERDGGQSDAVNKAIARAGGDVVAWINSDDYYPADDVVPAVLEAFDSAPGVDVVYGRATAVDRDGRAIRPFQTRRMRRLEDLLVFPTPPATQPAIFFRRELFLQAGGLRTDLHYAMDYDLWLRMFPRAREIRFLDRVLAHATFHADAKSIAHLGDQVRELAMLKRRHRSAFKLGVTDRLRLATGVAELYAYWAAVRLGLRRAT